MGLRRGIVSSIVLGSSLACAGQGGRSGGDGSDTGIVAGTSGTGTGVDASTAAGSSGTSTSSDTGNGFGAIFDVAATPDMGSGPDPIELTCANISEQTATSVGCEFFAVDLRMLQSNDLAYGISVGNPGMVAANVVIEDMRGPGGSLREVTSLVVGPGDSTLVAVNGSGGVLANQDHAVVTGANPRAAFHVRSDVPITAMQINPVGGGPSHVAEASLLLPVNALDDSHFAVGYPALDPSGGFVAVVGTEDGTTITTTGGMATIDAYDVQVYATSDPTGFFVGADAPVAVFSGATCTNIPIGVGACDHLEEQVVPASSWGTQYVGARHPVRITASNDSPEPVTWRVIAGVDDTSISLTPAVAGAEILLPQAGGFHEFTTTESFVAEGDHPFMLVQYMSGCMNVVPVPLNQSDPCNEPGTGDPYMIQIPPVDQWLEALPFLTDTSYPRDFVVLIREQGTSVDLACLGTVPADHFTPIPGTSFEVGSVDLDNVGGGEGACVDGEQFVGSSAPIGVLVGGVDYATSYGYAGGLAFSGLWTPPTEPPG